MNSIFNTKIDKNSSDTLNPNIDLMEIYKLTINELGIQQSKRDQTIAFYLTLSGIITGFLFGSSNISKDVSGLFLLLLGIIGIMLSIVIIRYRRYKEIYWITSRAISTLFSEKDLNNINEERLKNTFYIVLCKMYESIKCQKKQKLTLINTMKKSFFSAETLLFMTMLMVSTVVLMASAILLIPETAGALIAIGIFIFIPYFLYRFYCKQLINIYKVVELANEVEKLKAFKSVYRSAWFLHLFK